MAETIAPMNCRYCEGQDSCVIRETLPPDLLQEFNEARTSKTFRKKEYIFFQGATPTGLWIMCTGNAKITKALDDGRAIITRIARSGDMLGYRALLANENYTATAQALEDSTCTFIPRYFIDDLIKNHHAVAYGLIVQLSRELGSAYDKEARIALKDARSRVLETLQDLVVTHIQGPCEAGRPSIRMLRQDIAELTGLTVETTVRVLKGLEKEGAIALDGKEIRLLDQLDLTGEG